MEKLLIAITNSKDSKQRFAEKTKISFSRIARILYKRTALSAQDEKKIIDVYGENIFLPNTTQSV